MSVNRQHINIAPSPLLADFRSRGQEVAAIKAATDCPHPDVMDAHVVANLSFGRKVDITGHLHRWLPHLRKATKRAEIDLHRRYHRTPLQGSVIEGTLLR